ncbi:hypothetical protein AUC43_08590 [Hymenobacter sedentarius]|uniref:Porin n=1 Tax=Hymenobacter sedentarius TaxID=1411621 RepID=A0A0U4C4J5_9BACT|nr:hypothetical protein [Hymenobacter sedentarius]ALW85144.1 hypothetical protein AUC43_08590 [Hymenobacter sedentarius]
MKSFAAVAALVVSAQAASAQVTLPTPAPPAGPQSQPSTGTPTGIPAALKDGLKTYLSPDSTLFIKFNFLAQTWARYNESNPGTTVNGELEPHTTDVGIRRVRVVMSGQILPRVFVFVQFGQNSFSYLSPRKAGSFFHDVTADYAIIKKKLSLGAGLNGWNGPSRFGNSSASSILGVDLPLYQEVTNDVNDQNLRKLGVYAKGKLGKVDYRLAVGKPFATQTAASPEVLGRNSTFSTRYPHAETHGYASYQFWDQEGNAGAGQVGSYLGKKRVFNIGAGFVHQDKAMWNTTAAGDTLTHDLQLFAADVFYDAPVNAATGAAITAYACYSHYDFGPNYLKNAGAMNPANGVKASQGSFNGPGNNFALLGTGNVLYGQAGYLFKRDLLGRLGTLQPYAATQYARYNRLADPMVLVNAGVNWLLAGNASKLTLGYQNRPVFTAQANGDLKSTARRGEYILQYQVAF